MARKSLRRSQVIMPFGVGSLVDFPGETLMPAGLDVWPDKPECAIHDDRLARRLGVNYFRLPPPPPQKEHGQPGAYIPVVRFPLWHFCPWCRSMVQANWNEVKPPRCASTLSPFRSKGKPCCDRPEKRRWRMVPVRFVVVCEHGHIEDFPWVLWAHSRPGEPLTNAKVCSSPQLRLNYTGKAGLMGLVVKCEACDAKPRSLMGSAGPNSLRGLPCSGQRPWLGPNGTEACDPPRDPRMLQKGATNLHFAKVASSILIPPFTDPLRRLIDDPHNWSVLTSGVAEGGAPDEMRIKVFAELKRLDADRLAAVVEQKRSGVGTGTPLQTEEEFRYSEYEALSRESSERNDEFITVHPGMDGYSADVRKYFSQIVLVEKLAETRALTGFSRISPPPYREFDQNDRLQLSLQAKPWLPAVRVYGEGVFFTLRDEAVERWETAQVASRYLEIAKGHAQIYARLGRTPRSLSPRFFVLHSLAHMLIRRLSFECGYGSSSLRERIYCWDDQKQPMSGVLIYTAAGDSEGTMGGLVQQGKPDRFEALLIGALEDSLWCSSDPLCIESRGQGIDSLNRAACHACALLPETSCEEGNRFLDRVALVGTPADPGLGLFSGMVSRIISGSAVTP